MLKNVSSIDSYQLALANPAAFTGGTANSRGDYDGDLGSLRLFYVTGDVICKIFGVCTVNLAGSSATVEVGVTGNTAALIAQATATDIDANDIFNDAAPAVGTDTWANVTGPHVIVNGLDIYEKTDTANVTAGQIYYVCAWAPLSPGARVEADDSND